MAVDFEIVGTSHPSSGIDLVHYNHEAESWWHRKTKRHFLILERTVTTVTKVVESYIRGVEAVDVCGNKESSWACGCQ